MSGGKGTKRKGGKKQANTKGYSNEEWWAKLDAECAAVVKACKEAGGKGKKKVKNDCQASVSGVDSGAEIRMAIPQLRRQSQKRPANSLGKDPILTGVETEKEEIPTWSDDRSKWSPLAPLSK